ncbi:regulatory protein RecX [Sphingosinicella sp. CPCC 101087]|uniref:regulatory protein RecX n=1 Tax=Sphingosinicella sp. CPCC 101087 TaxID=2497754 RepID=UPI00101B6F53|nr:RecX family transcriptional regulator [Sphingosinicella sp. CPCC 101087]
MAVNQPQRRKDRPPLDQAGLEQAALGYVGRYATSRARLTAYLERKLRDRGWAGEAAPPLEELVERMAALGYVDDRAFAAARAASLARRGYGVRRVADALRAAGIDEEDGAEAREAARRGAWAAALRFAERRRIGPFARAEPSREEREKAFGALLRAGHSPDVARRLAQASPGAVPEADDG